MPERREVIEAFVDLGARMSMIHLSGRGQLAVDRAVMKNGWFTPGDIYRSAGAIAREMLDLEKLTRWSEGYPPVGKQKKIAVVMAGNIPLAGFFDMLCVLISGHRCAVKYSSKDTALMVYVTSRLKAILADLQIEEYDGGPVDAVIASGSDNAIRHLKNEFGDIPAIYRGNRSSAAILDGGETEEELSGLAADIFSYSGLGCRNVSHLLLPGGYDVQRLTGLAAHLEVNPKYTDNYRQRRAVLTLSGEEFTDCGNWILRQDREFPAILCEVTYEYYSTREECAHWARTNLDSLQCIVAHPVWNTLLPFDPTPFGATQSPTLYDYPDRVDSMEFLGRL